MMSRRGRVKLALALLFGVGLIAFRWTAPLGGFLVLSMIGLSLVMRFGPKPGRDEYRRSAYLRGPITYGVAAWGVWIEAGPLRAESAWAGVQTWHSRDGMLMLAATRMPPVYPPEARLREAGLYDRVMALAREHAAEFDSARSAETSQQACRMTRPLTFDPKLRRLMTSSSGRCDVSATPPRRTRAVAGCASPARP